MLILTALAELALYSTESTAHAAAASHRLGLSIILLLLSILRVDLILFLLTQILLDKLRFFIPLLVIIAIQLKSIVLGETDDALRGQTAKDDGEEGAEEDENCLLLQEVLEAKGQLLQLLI